MTPHEIYEALRSGPGPGSLNEAQGVSEAEARLEEERAERIRRLADKIAAGWEGSAADGAYGAAGPLADVARDGANKLMRSQLLLAQESAFFNSTMNSARPVPAKPPESNIINDMIPWETDLDREIRQYQEDAQHNIAVFSRYDNQSLANERELPLEFTSISDWSGDVSVVPPGSTPGGPPPGGGGPPPAPPGPGGGGPVPGGGEGGPVPAPSPGGVPTVGGQTSGQGTDPAASVPSPVAPPGAQPPGGGTPPGGGPGPVGGLPAGLPGTGRGPGSASRPGGPNAPGARSGSGTTGDAPGGRDGRGAAGEGPAGGRGSGTGGPGARGGGEAGAGGRGAGGSGGRAGAGGEHGTGARPGAGGLAAEEAAARRGMSGAAGARGAGAGGGFGPMAGGRGQSDEDIEHTRAAYLQEPDPEAIFGTDEVTAPPVIGEEDE